MNNELPEAVHEQIKDLCKQGDAACDDHDYRTAVAKYREAWKLVPEPKYNWEASTWILVALADAYLGNGDFAYARDMLKYAVNCPQGLGNPYVHLRLGQACFELGETNKAADELTRAYMGGGLKIFSSQDPKYLQFLRSKIAISE